MDVGRARDVGILDDAVRELDDRGGVLALEIGAADGRRPAVRAVGGADDVCDRADIDVVGRGGSRLGVLEIFLEERFEERGGNDAHVLDRQVGRLGERLALGIVEGVGHQHRDRTRAGPLVGENTLAPDDRVADHLDHLLVDLDFLRLRDQRQIGELGHETRGVLRIGHKFGIHHAVDEGGGVFRDLLEQRQILLGKFAFGAGGHFLVQHLDGTERDGRLERHREHRAHLEARGLGHRLHEGRLAIGVAEEHRLAGFDDFADDALSKRQFEGEELGRRILNFFSLAGSPAQRVASNRFA